LIKGRDEQLSVGSSSFLDGSLCNGQISLQCFGDIYRRPILDKKTRGLLAIAALTTLGHSLPQLKVHIKGALNVGVLKEEILETILQMSAYTGWPAALNALYTADEVFKSQKNDQQNAKVDN
jgi:4-carboxymuconolactone decarboxylase